MAIELLFLLLLAYLLHGPRKSARLAQKAGELLAQVNKIKAEVKAKMAEEISTLDRNG